MKNINNIIIDMKNTGTKFTLIIGSGFHKQFLKNKDSKFDKLKSWAFLLDFIKLKASISFTNSKNSILDFEKIIIDFNRINNTKEVAYKIENKLLGEIKDEIILLSKDPELEMRNELLLIFNNEIVSDIINLNFDLIIEKKLADITNTSKWNKLSKSINSKKNNDNQYRSINGIRFWHPHGDISSSKNWVLGLRKYGLQINKLEKFRSTYKANHTLNRLNFIEKNWLEVIMNKPLIIIGASLNQNEQDILFAIVNKKRNYIKSDALNPDIRSYVFQMLDKDEISNLGDLAIPLYPNMCFSSQWQSLLKLFSENEK